MRPGAACDVSEVKKYGLHAFVQLAWHVIEAEEFKDNWHIALVCAHLEAVTRGEIKELIINIPPGCMKSLLVSVFWPAWEWIHDPSKKFQFASFDDGLVLRDANKAKELVESPWFQERWGDRVQIQKASKKSKSKRSDSAGEYWTTALGLRFSSSVGGKATGWHAHTQVIDDPHKPSDTKESSGVMLQKTQVWYSGTMASRQANPERFARVIIMQRLHEDDLTGFCLKAGTYVHLRLPMEYEPENPCVTKWGADPRTQPNELLWPARYSAEHVAKLKHPILGLGAYDYAAQYQQRPTPAGGGIFLREWFVKRWSKLPDDPSAPLTWLQSWDLRFKSVDTSGDFVVGQVWAYTGANFYLVREYRGRWSFSDTIAQILIASQTYPQAMLKLIEAKANGEAVVNVLENKVPGLVLVEPLGGKDSRANAVAPLCEAGNVWIPDALATGEFWVDEFVDEVTHFPRSKFDDRVDAMTQALVRMNGDGMFTFMEAMKNINFGRR